MQDRFRFRFWDKGTQTMQKFPKVELKHRITLDKIFFDDRVIFMQCTGLKDKKDKLIYEGDIVKFKTELSEKPKQIIWDECHYILKDTFIILCNMEIKQFGLEVIGNIYENPELLEA
jgi:uncharacterized phage protein (TIGR01671 family)